MNSTATSITMEQEKSVGGFARWATELSILLRIQFANVRDSWVWIFLMATLFPLTTLLFMMFLQHDPNKETIASILAGNLIFGIIVMGMNGLGQDISWQKHQGHFVFYASLPISKMNFVVANLFRGLMNTLPSFVILWWLGQWIFGIQLHFSPMLPIVILLCLSSVVGFGIILAYESFCSRLKTHRFAFSEKVVSHGDLHMGNYAKVNGKIMTLDWEHTHLNSRMWDLYHVIDMSHPLFPS